MKQIFFFAILVVLPIVVFGGGLVYLVWHTCYSLYDDWQLNRELEEIRAASRAKRGQTGGTPPPSETAEEELAPDDEISSTTVTNGDRQVREDDA